jgi:hypothetical protein
MVIYILIDVGFVWDLLVIYTVNHLYADLLSGLYGILIESRWDFNVQVGQKNKYTGLKPHLCNSLEQGLFFKISATGRAPFAPELSPFSPKSMFPTSQLAATSDLESTWGNGESIVI